MPSSFDQNSLVDLILRLRSESGEIEQQRCVSPTIVELARETGLFRALVPKRYGGLESRMLPVLEGLTRLGEASASTSWVFSLFAGHSLIGAWFPQAAQDALWSEKPDTLIGSSLAPMGELSATKDGYSLRGRWSFSSGIDHADWLILGARNEQQLPILALIPRREAEIHDDWFVCGLQGTGSKSLTVKESFVADPFVLPVAVLESGRTPGHEVNHGPLYRFPWRPAFSFSFVPPALGAAKAALSISRAYLAERVSAYTGQNFAGNPVGWIRLAESAAEIETAETLLRRDVGELENALGEIPRSLLHRACYTPAQIVSLCKQSVSRLFQINGAQALYQDGDLQRIHRDLQAVAQHPGVNIDIAAQAYGRGLLENQDLKVAGREAGAS